MGKQQFQCKWIGLVILLRIQNSSQNWDRCNQGFRQHLLGAVEAKQKTEGRVQSWCWYHFWCFLGDQLWISGAVIPSEEKGVSLNTGHGRFILCMTLFYYSLYVSLQGGGLNSPRKNPFQSTFSWRQLDVGIQLLVWEGNWWIELISLQFFMKAVELSHAK